MELLNIPTTIGSATMTIVPRSGSSNAANSTMAQSPQMFDSIHSLPSNFNTSSSQLSHSRMMSNSSNASSSSNPVFDHSDPRLMHGDAYLQPISTSISTSNSSHHGISSAVSGSNPSLYRSIDDNGMDSPTYIQLESSGGAILPPGGSYSPVGNSIYSTTPISLSGGNVIGNLGHKQSIDYSDVPVDPSIYAIKSNPSSHR